MMMAPQTDPNSIPGSTMQQNTETMVQAQIYLDQDDMYQEEPLSEHILRYLMHHEIRGATLFRADRGYGAQRHLHAPGRIGTLDERPIMITFIDTSTHVRAILPYIRSLLTDGIIVTSQVELW